MKDKMTFIQVLESEFYYLIEAIEHGSSDNELIENYKKELYKKQDINTLRKCLKLISENLSLPNCTPW